MYNLFRLLFFSIIFFAANSSLAQDNTDSTSLLQLDLNAMLAENESGSLLLQKTSLGSDGEGSVAEAFGIVEVVDKREILAFGGNTLSDILNRLVNFYMASPSHMFNNQTTMRGDLPDTYSSHVLLLLNGRPLRESFFGSSDMGFVNTIAIQDIERIELIRGTGSVLYGIGSFTALINFVMKNDKITQTSLQTTAGAYRTRGFIGIQSYNKRNFTLHASTRYYGQEAGGTTFQSIDSVERTLPQDNQNFGTYISAEGKKAYARVFYGISTAYVLNNMLTWGQGNGDDFDQVRSKRLFVDVGYKGSFSKKWNYSLRNTSNGHSIIFSVFDNKKAKFNSMDNMIDFTNYIKFNKKSTLAFGLSVNNATWNSKGSLDENGKEVNLLAKEQDNTLMNTLPILYGQLDYKLWKRLKLVAATQVVGEVSEMKLEVAPRLGLIYLQPNGLGIKAIYGKAIMPHTGIEHSYRSPRYLNPTPDLEHESTQNLDVQFFGQFKTLQFGATYYNTRQQDVITRRFLEKDLYTLYNMEWLNIEGIEFECKASVGSRFLLCWNFSYFQTKNSEGERNVTGVPAITTCAGLGYFSKNKAIQTGIYNVFFTKPYDVANAQKNIDPSLQRVLVNPVPRPFDLICINFAVDITTAFRMKDWPKTVVSLYGENILGTTVWQPEVFNRRINSIPYQNIGVRAFYLNAAISF